MGSHCKTILLKIMNLFGNMYDNALGNMFENFSSCGSVWVFFTGFLNFGVISAFD